MFKNLERIQLNPVKSTVTLGIPIMILLILDTLYSVVDTYWIGGLGFSAFAALVILQMWHILPIRLVMG